MSPTVCHVISGYFRTDARIFHRQCKTLRDEGFSVVILTNDGLPDESKDGIAIMSCVSLPAGRFESLCFAKKMFLRKALQLDADIYQLHSPELLPLARPLLKRGKKVVYDAHEDMPRHLLEKEWLPKIIRSVVSRVFSWYMYGVFRSVNEVISPHFHVVADAQLKAGKGIMVANFPIVRADDGIEFATYASRPKSVCYTGTAYSFSNQAAVAEAISEVEAATYSIAGHLSPKERAKIEARLPASRFAFLGRLDHKELIDFYGTQLAGLVIYDYMQNIGGKTGTYGTNKIFEYMEAGLPVICTDFDLWQDFVEDYKCGYCVAPGDVEAIRNAVRAVLKDRKTAWEMGRRGRRAIEEKFNWKSEARKYSALMHSLALSSQDTLGS
jgi:glycosyltransferase involved in cell wall biosynthesis